MSKWGWKHSALFVLGLLCATSALVTAGLAKRSTDAAAAMATVSAR